MDVFANANGFKTPELGIMNGAAYISKKWINSSDAQNTLYAMRWNPNNPGQGQYATDINWAIAQAKNISINVNKMQQMHPKYKVYFSITQYKK